MSGVAPDLRNWGLVSEGKTQTQSGAVVVQHPLHLCPSRYTALLSLERGNEVVTVGENT